MNETTTEKTSRKDTAIRLLFVILFAGIYSVAELVLYAIVILQFIFKLISGELNAKLVAFSKSLNHFIYQILQYVTFNRDEMPFPFAEWPSADNPTDPES